MSQSFYRVESTEFLEEGLGSYIWFVNPTGLTKFLDLFDDYKDTHYMGEPSLVEIEINEDGEPLKPEADSAAICYFVGM